MSARSDFDSLVLALRRGSTLDAALCISVVLCWCDAEGNLPISEMPPIATLLEALSVFLAGENVSI
jgi:hypothetical protein